MNQGPPSADQDAAASDQDPATATYDPQHRVWLLSTPATSYVVRLSEPGFLEHRYWGPRLDLAQAASIGRVPRRTSGFQEIHDGAEEYPVDGGTRYGAPALRVRFADGARSLEPDYAGHEIVEEPGGALLRLHLRDRNHPLQVTLHYRVRAGTDVIERWTVVANLGGTSVELLRADAACWAPPVRPAHRLTHVTGQWLGEHELRSDPVTPGMTVLGSTRGITSHQANPWAMIDAGDAGERHGEVWSMVLAWSGSWRIAVTRDASGRLTCGGGAGQDGVGRRLDPGEQIRTPVFAGLYRPDGFGATSRAWHAYALAHVLPHPGEQRPVLYNSWEATGFDVDETGQRDLAARAAGLGAELFVLDDGWFTGRTGDRAGLGDWDPDPDRFPRGLAPLADEVHRLGMRFGLWVEPEMVNPDSELYRAHPDWVLHEPGRRRSTLRHQLVLNFARPDVAAWAYDRLDRLVGEYDVDFLKWDMNRAFSEAGWPESDDPGRLWTEHVEAVYALIDRLRSAYPRLRIEACSGGGGRTDLGMLARTDQVWVSDNTDALDRLRIQDGYSRIYPARAMASWVTDVPNFGTGRSLPLRFRFLVAMTGVLGVGADLTRWSDAELAQARTLVELYKDVRPVVQHGRLHRLSEGLPPGHTAVQYVAEDGDRVVVFAFRHGSPYGTPLPPVRLGGLDPWARYRDEDTGTVWHAAVLAHHGLPIELPAGDPSGALARLRRLPR